MQYNRATKLKQLLLAAHADETLGLVFACFEIFVGAGAHGDNTERGALNPFAVFLERL